MAIRVLNPTSESMVVAFEPAPRLQSLKGKTVGLISNGKEGTTGFFAHVDRLLRERYQVAEVILRTKSNYSAPAEDEIIDDAKSWDLAITGLGD
ncbi:MAG: hypothetical protein CNF02_08185 [OM182 bacterium MED-G28]|uniref:UGSC-like domain-containing protein n=1 Tax=OM182 bacterium MED-G28 TaxID=1986256 RepID=A0A2A5WB91_9GAMM|nr:MAG: hypothetical protein CNF02_08185 [OM182 bacterium MED-G28]